MAAHERLLGRSPGACARATLAAGGAVELDGLGDRAAAALRAGTGRVAVTVAGLAGDSGMAAPAYHLALRGPSRERLLADYARWRVTRGVVRVASRGVLAESGPFVAAQSGYDLRETPPPFFPVLRNEDGLFAALLRLGRPDHFVGHLPWAVEHAPPETRRFAPEELFRPWGRLRMADLVQLCAAAGAMPPDEPPGGERWTALGAHFRALGELPPEAFARFVRERHQERLAAQIVWLTGSLQAYERRPAEWAADVVAAVKELRARLEEPAAWVPADLPADRDPAALGRKLVGRYGELLEAWPALTAAALRLRERGEEPFEPCG